MNRNYISPLTYRDRLRDLGRAALHSPVVLVVSLIAFVAFVLPVIMVTLGAFLDAAPGSRGDWTLASFATVISSSSTYVALKNSLVLALGAVLFGVGSAVVLAWLAVRSDSRLRSIVTPGMVLLFAIPQLFYAMSWIMLGQSPAGTLNWLSRLVTGTEAAPIDLVSWAGLILIMGLKISSISYLLLIGPFGSVNSAFEEAGRVCGSTRWGALFRIELPILSPALLSAAVLGVVIAVGSLDIPLLLGGTAGVPFLSTEIYAAINTRVPADYAAANSTALFVVALVAIAVLGQRSLLAKRQFTTVSGKSHRRERVSLGSFRWVGGALIAAYFIVALVLPLGQLVLSSLQPYAGVFTQLTLNNYAKVLMDVRTLDAFVATVWIGLLSGLLATAGALVISIIAHRSTSPLRQVPQTMTLILLAVPGITIGLGVLAVVLTVPGMQWLYGTQWLNVIGLAVTMTPIANRVTAGAVVQVSVELEEAARMSGATALRANLQILTRLILPSFLAGWFITAIVAAGNLEIPALLSSPGSETLTIVALQYFQLGSYAEASAVFCLMLAFIAVAMVIAQAVRGAMVLARRYRDHSPSAEPSQSGSAVLARRRADQRSMAGKPSVHPAANIRDEEKTHV